MVATETMIYFGSLFSGVGGFDLGLEQAGMECAWQVEIDKNCISVLNHHWSKVSRYEDIKDVGRKSLEKVDLICGGFPCQDLSVAGRREGLDGERSRLWFEFHRVLRELRPRWCIIENVPGLLSSNKGRDFAILLQGLVELGYGVCWRVFDAQYAGVPQRRRRVFIVGHLGDGRAAEVLFEREGGCWDPPPSREAGQGIAGTLDKKSTSSNRGSQANEGDFIVADSPTISIGIDSEQNADEETIGTLRSHKSGGAELMVAYKKRGGFGISETGDMAGTLEAEGGTHQGGPERVPFVAYGISNQPTPKIGEDVCPSLDAKENGGGRMECVAYGVSENQRAELLLTDYSHQLTSGGGKPGQRYPCVAFTERTRADGRNVEAQDDLAYALTNPGNGGRAQERRVAGSFGVRRLTPTECERLQGFPDGWTLAMKEKKSGKKNIPEDAREYLRKQFIGAYGRNFEDEDEFRILMSDTQRYRQMGNAVAVPVIKQIGERIVQVDSEG